MMQRQVLPIKFSLLFWLLYFLYEWFGLAALSGDYSSYFINACVALPFAFLLSYFTVHILLTKYYDVWPRLQFWFVQILGAILLLLVKRCVNYFLIYPRFFPHALNLPFFSFGKLIVELVNVYLIVGVYSLFYFVRNWYEQRQQVQDLLQQKTSAELELLKSQVQPHFIFNTLNNIYSTAIKTSPDTARLIAQLSSFLSYNLYDARERFVPLAAEIDYIRNYIELQQHRYGQKLDASINLYNSMDGVSIAPWLLLPLVENSIKHGVANAIGQSWIRIDFSRQDNSISVKIENSVEKEFEVIQKGGLGLQNLARQLALVYPGRHEFKTLNEQFSYLAVLKITIS